MTRWTLGPGRAIECDGVTVAYIERVRDERTGNAPLTPYEANELAEHIVDVLNQDDIENGPALWDMERQVRLAGERKP